MRSRRSTATHTTRSTSPKCTFAGTRWRRTLSTSTPPSSTPRGLPSPSAQHVRYLAQAPATASTTLCGACGRDRERSESAHCAFERVDGAHLGVGGSMVEEPLVRFTHAGVEVDLRFPPCRGKAADIERLARR